MNMDFYDDGGVLLLEGSSSGWRHSKLAGLITSAEYLGDRKLPDSEYAVILKTKEGNFCRFPRNDPGNTVLSAIYLGKRAAELPTEVVKTAATNLAAGMLGFRIPVGEGLLKLAGVSSADQVKEVSPFVTYVEKVKVANASVEDQVRRAARTFNEDFALIHPAERAKIASTLLPLAEKHHVPLREEATLYARGMVSEERIKTACRRRHYLTGAAVYKEMEKCAALIMDDAADLLHEADVATGAYRHWGNQLEDPIASVLVIPVRVPERIKVGSASVDGDKLSKLALNHGLLSSHFGDHFAKTFAKDPVTVFRSLPDTTKEAVMALAR